MKPIEVKIKIDELCAIKNQADAMETHQKLADDYKKKWELLMMEVSSLRFELNEKNPDSNAFPVMPKDIADTFRTAENLLFAEDDSHALSPGKDVFVLCVRGFVKSIAKYFTTPKGGAE